jgi:HEAT repeat protein
LETLDVLPQLLTALEDEEPWVRYYSVKAIANLARGGWGDAECFARSKRQEARGGVSVVQAFDALARLARTDTAYQVKAAATEALGLVGGVKAIPILASLAQLEDKEGDVARSAIAALGQISDASAVAPLLTALNSTNPERRLDAIRAFRNRGGNEAGMTLQWMAAADTDNNVVQAAIESLSRMATQESIYSLLELTVNPGHREACIAALATRGGLGFQTSEFNYSLEEYIEAIAKGLNHLHAEVRYAVVEVLTRLKHPLASELLLGALDDSDSSVRLAAVNALGLIGNRSCDDKLTLMAHGDPDPSVRRAAQKIIRN